MKGEFQEDYSVKLTVLLFLTTIHISVGFLWTVSFKQQPADVLNKKCVLWLIIIIYMREKTTWNMKSQSDKC